LSDEKSPKPVGFLSGLYRALVAPDKSFRREDQFYASRFLLFLLIFVLVFLGSVLTQKFFANDTMRMLSMEEASRRIEKMMDNAPKEQREAAIQRAQQSQGGGMGVMMVVGLILSASIWPLFVLEVWFLGIILMQFLGGEEKPIGEKKHRRSLYLALYALIPLALQALAKGAVFYFKDPSDIGSVLTLAEYMEAAEVSFSLVALLGVGELSGFLKYLLHNLTNPFCLWSLSVAIFGGKSVFAVRSGKMLIAVSVIFVLIGLQSQLLTMITGVFGG
jgi:hypothetical protein